MLRIANMTLSIGTRVLCAGLDLTLSAGELWAILGCNGSGKTTLLHAMAGLAHPGAGNVYVGEKPAAQWSRRALAQRVGLLLQREDAEFYGTVRDYVMLGRYPHASPWAGPGPADDDAVARALAAFDLGAVARQPYATLSGGERQRARLAQMWAQDPGVLLLDEPLQHLDLRHQLQSVELVRSAVRDARRCAVMVLHDLSFAARCDRVLLLHGDGRHESGTAAQMLEPARLERLYGCRVRVYGTGADTHLVPVI